MLDLKAVVIFVEPTGDDSKKWCFTCAVKMVSKGRDLYPRVDLYSGEPAYHQCAGCGKYLT